MDAAAEAGVGFAASRDGGFILPGFLPAFDAAAALVKMLELLARDGTPPVRGGRRAAARPHRPRDGRHAVGAEGRRHAHARRAAPRTASVVLVDGVKVLHDDGWALALPDPEEPVTHVWAEGRDRRRGPPPGRRSTPAASASCCAEPARAGTDRSAQRRGERLSGVG